MARLHVEDGYPAPLLSQQFGMSDYSVYRWSKRYRLHGEQGLKDRPRKPGGSKLPSAVTENIVELKKENPSSGARRISDILKRFFLVGASPYITGLGFYRSQTAENVIETYRRAVGESGVPKEMLHLLAGHHPF